MDTRFKKVKNASILGILGNFFLFVIKFMVSIISKSEAMLADAFNSLSDILSSFMAFIGNLIASKPRDDDHNLGHGKAEYIYSLFISFMMIILSLKVGYDGFLALFFKSEYYFSIWLIVVCVITILLKLGLYLYNRALAKKINNVLLEASYKDHRNDIVITTFNLLSVVLGFYGFYLFDAVVSIGIALWIFKEALVILKKSYDVLMDKSISLDAKNQVLDIIKAYPEIKKINHFNSTPIGYQYQISLTIFVDGNLSTFASHDIANKLEKEITQKIPEVYLTIIHVNPL